MKETSPSPFSTARYPTASGDAVGSPAEKPTPAIRVKSLCCSSSLSSSPSSSSSSINSSNSSLSSYSSRLGSPMTPASPFCSSSSIPFSWEKQPGVPKHAHLLQCPKEHPHPSALPPPPPLRSNSHPFLSLPRKRRPGLRLAAPDPFAVALMECSKEDGHPRPAEQEDDAPRPYWKGASSKGGGRRRTVADLFRFVDMYASCKTTCSVADSTVYLPRSGRGMAAYSLLGRRAG